MFLPLYKREFLHSACISKMHYSDWKLSKNQLLSWNFERVRFWIECFSTCQIQKYNFYNPTDSGLIFLQCARLWINFLLRGQQIEKKYWIETHHIFIDILQEKDDNFVIWFAYLKWRIVTKLFIFQSDFELKQLQRVRFWITNFEPVRFCINAFRTCHTLNWFFSEKIRSWKKLWSKKFCFDTFLPVKTTIAAFCLRF